MNLKASFRALSLLVVLDSKGTVDGARALDHRNRKHKYSSSRRSSRKNICLGTEGMVFPIRGAREGQTVVGDIELEPDCFDVDNPLNLQCLTVAEGCPNFAAGCPLLTEDIVDRKCSHYTEPFMFNRDTGVSAQFEFTTDQKTIGRGSFYGEIPKVDPDCRFDKILIEYWGADLINQPADTLEILSYDFYQNTCPGDDTAVSCANQFYLNVYLRTDATSNTFFDCRLDFVPPDSAKGAWATMEVTPDTVASRACGPFVSGGGTTCTPASACPTTLQQAADAGYVFGSGGFCNGFSFQINMGDTEPSDEGLTGYFDRIILKYEGEDAARVYNLDPK